MKIAEALEPLGFCPERAEGVGGVSWVRFRGPAGTLVVVEMVEGVPRWAHLHHPDIIPYGKGQREAARRAGEALLPLAQKVGEALGTTAKVVLWLKTKGGGETKVRKFLEDL